jgi:hypothetical protein
MREKKSVLGLIAVLAILFVSLSVASAQYATQLTANVTIGSNGIVHVAPSSTVGGVAVVIAGTPGATGSVSTAVYSANPQTGASLPSSVTLTHFFVVSFNMTSSDFQSANITVTYTDSDVTGMNKPYSLYKYDASSNSYIVLPSTVDTDAKTITATVTSITDPLLAIGGTLSTSTSGSGIPTWTWVVVVGVVLVVVVVAVLLLSRRNPYY